MKYSVFGPTNKKVFRVGIGTYGHGDAYGRITKKESLEILRTAVEYAPTEAYLLIDTAPRYGEAIVETWIGEFLRESKTDRILVATKGGRHIEPGRVNEKDFGSRFLKTDLEASLQRLGLKKVFLYQLHNPSLATIVDGSVFDVLEEMRKEEKIEWYGVSIDTAEEGIKAIEYCRERGYQGLASLQVIYNIFQKNVLNELCKMGHQNNVAIIAREPLLRGFLSDLYQTKDDLLLLPEAPRKVCELFGQDNILSQIASVRQLMVTHHMPVSLAQLALQFVLANPYVTTVIPGMNRKEFVATDFSIEKVDVDLPIIEKLNELKNFGC